MSAQSFEELVDGMSQEVWYSMRRAVETGRWPDGRVLTREQRELSLQAVLAWEIRHQVPEHERTGYVAPAACDSHDHDAEQPVTLREPTPQGSHDDA